MQSERWVHGGGEPFPEELEELGYDHPRQAMSLPAHAHEGAFEFVVIEQGHATWDAPDGIYETNAGDVFHTNPGELHKGGYEVIEPCRLWWVQLHVPIVGKHQGGGGWLHLADDEAWALVKGLYALPRVHHGGPVLFSYLRVLRDTASASGPLARATCRFALLGFLLALMQPGETKEIPSDILPGLQRIVFEMHTNKAWRPRVDELAARVGLSVSHLHRVFRDYTGMSPIEYGERVRMQEACERLEHSQQSILRIATDLGYSTSQHFSTVFRRTTGQTPTQWRRRMQDSEWAGKGLERRRLRRPTVDERSGPTH